MSTLLGVTFVFIGVAFVTVFMQLYARLLLKMQTRANVCICVQNTENDIVAKPFA